MIKRKLFGTNNLIREFTDSLIVVETSESGWTTKYYNDLTNEYWLQYVVDDRNFYTNLILLSPRPTTEELIDIAFSSPYIDEVSAAATRLYLDEQEGKAEFRGDLMGKLSEIDVTNITAEEKGRIKTIIQASDLMHGINMREIVGKHYLEIEKDAQFFRSISEKARILFEKL